MQRIAVEENGLVGALHLPQTQGPHPLIVALGGFRGGLNEVRSEKLAKVGLASLALAYFGCKGLPETLQEIPLEYFEKGIAWAVKNPAIDAKRIALWGVSRGAELSLILGSLFPDRFRAIAATLPSSAIYGSIVSDAPAWIYGGKPIGPGAPFPKLQLSEKQEKPLALTPYFLEGMLQRDAFHAALIPVEKITCPLLLISGEDDQMWPSSLFAEQIMERLQNKSESLHFSYPRAGHGISSTEETAELHPVAKIWFAFGGNPSDNAKAMHDSWEKTIQFFRLWLD